MNVKLFLIFSLIFISVQSIAQTEVHEEPLHRPVFTKSNVRVLDVRANPGDTSLVHQHSNNYFYVTISGGTVWLESPGETARTIELPTGFIGGYYDNPKRPHVHRFANLSSNPIRLIAVENLSFFGNPADSIYHLNTKEQLVIDNAYFRVTKVLLQQDEKIDLKYAYPAVIINQAEKSLQFITKKKFTDLPTWIWLDPNKKTSLNNPYPKEARAIILQIKTGS